MANGSGNTSNIVQSGAASSTASGTSNPSAVLPVTNVSNSVTLALFGGTGGNYQALYAQTSPSASATQYQVPTGKTLYITSIIMDGTQNTWCVFGYGTAALGSNDTSSAPTGNVIYGPSITAKKSPFFSPLTTSTGKTTLNCLISFPALSYPYAVPTTSNDAFFIFTGFIA